MSLKRVQEMLKILDERGYSLADLSELFNCISEMYEFQSYGQSTQYENDKKEKSHREATLSEEEKNQIQLIMKITNLLLELGFSAHARGFNYTRDALIMVYNNPFNTHIMQLYSELGEKTGVTATSIERGIRYSIEAAWNRGNVSTYEKYFGFSVNPERGKPSIGQFISTIVDYLKLHP